VGRVRGGHVAVVDDFRERAGRPLTRKTRIGRGLILRACFNVAEQQTDNGEETTGENQQLFERTENANIGRDEKRRKYLGRRGVP